MALAPLDPLIAIIANILGLGGRFDALRINAARRRLGISTLIASLPLAQLLHDTCPAPSATPALEIAIHGVPVTKRWRNHAPLAARLIEVENAVDDRT